jgi:Beta-propeller repeat
VAIRLTQLAIALRHSIIYLIATRRKKQARCGFEEFTSTAPLQILGSDESKIGESDRSRRDSKVHQSARGVFVLFAFNFYVGNHLRMRIAATLLFTLFMRTTYAELPYAAAWTRQFGTNALDNVYSVAVDGSGRVYVVGRTDGLLGTTNAGAGDAFVKGYDSQGNARWTQQFGTSALDEAHGVAVDGTGNVFVSGMTKGNLSGINAGDEDGFLRKYDSAGSVQWTGQFGTPSLEDSRGVAVDATGNAYAIGFTNGNLAAINAGPADAFIRKYTTAGSAAWTKQACTTQDDVYNAAVADGSGNVIVAGASRGNFGGPPQGLSDVIVRKYDSTGNVTWTTQFGGTVDDYGLGLSRDASGNVYVTGRYNATDDNMTDRNFDAFVTKISSTGAIAWTKTFSTPVFDVGFSTAVDSHGNVFVAGSTLGSLVGANQGGFDAHLSKYDTNGNLSWRMQFGTSAFDSATSLAVDTSDNLYLAGRTDGSPFSANLGMSDAYLVKLIPALPGDYNHNGIVDAADYTVWRDSLGRTGTLLAADGNGNGRIDAGDYETWKSNFGNHSGSGADAKIAVPEPGALLMLAVGILVISVPRSLKH